METNICKMEVYSNLSEDYYPAQNMSSLKQRVLACSSSGEMCFSALDDRANLWISLSTTGTNMGYKLFETQFASLASATMIDSQKNRYTFGAEISDLFVLKNIGKECPDRFKLNFNPPFTGALLVSIKPVNLTDGPICLALWYKDSKAKYHLSLLIWEDTSTNKPMVWHTLVATDTPCGEWFLDDLDTVAFTVWDNETGKISYCDVTENRVTTLKTPFRALQMNACHVNSKSTLLALNEEGQLHALHFSQAGAITTTPFFSEKTRAFDSFQFTFANRQFFLLARYNGKLYSCNTPSTSNNSPNLLIGQEENVEHFELDKYDRTTPHYTCTSILGGSNDVGNVKINHYDPATGLWKDTDSLQCDAKNEFKHYYCYTTDIKFLDSENTPCPDAEIVIWTAADCRLSINNLMYYVSPGNKIIVKTNPAGKLTLYEHTETTSAIDIILQVKGGEEYYTIKPDQQNMKLWSTLTAEQLDSARTSENKPLVDKDFGGEKERKQVLDNVANTIRSTMGHIVSSHRLACEADPAVGLKLSGDTRRFVRCHHSDPTSFLNALPGNGLGYCRIVFAEGGQLQYHALNSAECHSARTALYAHHHLEMPKEACDGFFSKIGDFFKSVFKKIVHVAEIIIEGVRVTISFLEESVKKIGEFIVSTVHEAIRLVETVLHYIEVALEKIVEWIGILFNWSDFVFVKKALIERTRSTMEKVKPILKTATPEIARYFNSIKGNLNSFFDSLEGFDFDRECQAGQTSESAEEKEARNKAETNNVVYNKIVASTDNTLCTALFLPKEGVDILESIMKKLGDLAKSLHQPIDQAKERMMHILSKKCTVNGLVAVLVEILRLIANMVLEAISQLTEILLSLACEVLDMFWKLLETPLNIPVVSDLIKFFTHEDVSLLDIVMYVLAIPFTIIYKCLHRGKAPFKMVSNADEGAVAWTSTISCLLYYVVNTITNSIDTAAGKRLATWYDKLLAVSFTTFEMIWVFTNYDFGDMGNENTLAYFIVDTTGILYDVVMTGSLFCGNLENDALEFGCEFALAVSYIIAATIYSTEKKVPAFDKCVNILPGVHDFVQAFRFASPAKPFKFAVTGICGLMGGAEATLMIIDSAKK